MPDYDGTLYMVLKVLKRGGTFLFFYPRTKALRLHFFYISPPQLDQKFFNRQREEGHLAAWLRKPPNQVLVMVGPHSAGKTAFLNEMLVKHPGRVGLGTPALFLHARTDTMTSAGSLKESLLLRGSAYESARRSWWGSVAGSAVKIVSKGVEVPVPLAQPEKEASIAVVLHWIASELEATRIEGKPAPVFVVDEANRLMVWESADLQTFMDFCIQVRADQSPPLRILLFVFSLCSSLCTLS